MKTTCECDWDKSWPTFHMFCSTCGGVIAGREDDVNDVLLKLDQEHELFPDAVYWAWCSEGLHAA